MSQFLCPKCCREMREDSRSGVPHEICDGCDGVWLDHSSLNLWIQKRLGAEGGDHAAQMLSLPQSVETSLACPRCPSFLLECTTNAGLVIDWCNGCRGLFLDSGELGDIESRARAERAELRKDTVKAGWGVIMDVLLELARPNHTYHHSPEDERKRNLEALWNMPRRGPTTGDDRS